MGYTSFDIAHAWANEQDRAHSGSSDLHHWKGQIRSFSTVIGQIVHCTNGNTVYLLNDKSYSKCTSRHQDYVLAAIPSSNRLSISAYGFRYNWGGLCFYGEAPEAALEALVVKIVVEFFQRLHEFANSTTLKTEGEVSIPTALINDYIRLTNCTTWSKLLRKKSYDMNTRLNKQTSAVRRVIKLMSEDCRNIAQYVIAAYGQKVWDKYYALTAPARKIRETRLAKEDPTYVKQEISVNYDVKAEAEKERKRMLARHRRQAQELRKRQEKDEARRREWIEEWRNNKNISLPYLKQSECNGGNVILRLHKDNIVQTSKGIALTVDECARLWKLISIWHEDESKFDEMSERRVMAIKSDWTINSYHNDLLRAGCHTIAYKEMENLARTLKFID